MFHRYRIKIKFTPEECVKYLDYVTPSSCQVFDPLERKQFNIKALMHSISYLSTHFYHLFQKTLGVVFRHHAIPFIGFGFLDNFIMILAGEYIEHTIGLTFHFSVMACAALGNTISDVCGIGLAGYVETLCVKMGLPVPTLTPAESNHTWVSNFIHYTCNLD